MKVHQLNDAREIINTIIVKRLDDLPNLVDASIGGKIGDRVGMDGGLVVTEAVPQPQVRRITPFAFRDRFTQAEKVLIDIASIDDPSVSMENRCLAAAIRVNLADLAVAFEVDLDHPGTRKGVLDLYSAGILKHGRPEEILDSPVLFKEQV